MKRDAMEREAVKILRTNHPVVLDNIVWLRRAIADALLKVQRRERRRTSAMLRERETIERAAELLGKVRAIQEAKLSSLATEVDRAIAQAMIEALRISEDNIRALAEEGSREE